MELVVKGLLVFIVLYAAVTWKGADWEKERLY